MAKKKPKQTKSRHSRKEPAMSSMNLAAVAPPAHSGRGKLTIAVVVIVIVALIIIFRPDKMLAGTEAQPETTTDVGSTVTTAPSESQAPAAQAPASAQPAVESPPPVQRQTYNDAILSEELTFPSFPMVKEATLESRMKYSVSFETDEPVHFFVYPEAVYNYWRETGYHGHSKANSRTADDCCAKKGAYSFDVNEGEGGRYFFVFDDSELGTYDERPTKGHLEVVKTTNI